MLQKILELRNVGLFKHGAPSGAVEFEQITLVYGENGRGKSTFATVLRACSGSDPGPIVAKSTLDSDDKSVVSLLFASKGKSQKSEFKGGNWRSAFKNIYVFDSEFADRNVYSGFEVNSDHRKELLVFALGDEAVELQQKIAEVTQETSEKNKEIKELKATLSGHHNGLQLEDFIALPSVEDLETRIDSVNSRIAASQRVEVLKSRALPRQLHTLDYEMGPLFRLLSTELTQISRSAEDRVRAHVTAHRSPEFEDWIAKGQEFLIEGQCPYCDQHTGGLDLVTAYQGYFNREYVNLKQEVAGLQSQIETHFGTSRADALQQIVAQNDHMIATWQEETTLPTTSLEIDRVKALLEKCYLLLTNLVTSKVQHPFEAVGVSGEQESIALLVDSINEMLNGYNSQIFACREFLEQYRQSLESADTAELEQNLRTLNLTKKRYLPEARELIADYQSALAAKRQLDGKKTELRQKLDHQMTTTLETYQERVNELLRSFGASFTIQQLKADYRGAGGSPRSNYGLAVRDVQVNLGKRSDTSSTHSFGSALSEADKRTLAFAFFVSRLEQNVDLSEYVVVLDDPVSSLDMNRRRQSIRTIANIAEKCGQLIVLSHDPHFLRDLRSTLSNPSGKYTLLTLKIHRVSSDYSAFDECDIDRLCESDYYRHYRIVEHFVQGDSSNSARDVAKALRPLLEGYYHRKYPGLIPRGRMFGQIIESVRNVDNASPLANLKNDIQELTEINEYARQFHHDSNPDSESVAVTDSELLVYCKRVQTLIHRN